MDDLKKAPIFLRDAWSICVTSCREANILDNTFNALMDDIESQLDEIETFHDDCFKEEIRKLRV